MEEGTGLNSSPPQLFLLFMPLVYDCRVCVVPQIVGSAQNQAAKRMDIRELSEGTVRIA